ncbi:hypothetical protein LAZ67_X004384 [Cordylochernes scorpioides]|uniref:Uncharacterized protein n=1 Tax=Cordylochernes scorpioides TaxID=51811 RepID=A0ABY6LVB9_9ARAC|nr:hypothetical protein LAZ67_X004384 [Cordylochernes scorpioides]
MKTGSTTQWQADLAPKEMAASDMRNRRQVNKYPPIRPQLSLPSRHALPCCPACGPATWPQICKKRRAHLNLVHQEKEDQNDESQETARAIKQLTLDEQSKFTRDIKIVITFYVDDLVTAIFKYMKARTWCMNSMVC